MTRSKKVCLTIFLVIVGMFAVVVWSEATDKNIFSESFLERARKAGKEDSALVKQFERETADMRSSLSAMTFCAIGITLLSFGSIVWLWIPPTGAENDSPEKEGQTSQQSRAL